MTINAAVSLNLIAGAPGDDDHPFSQDVIDLLAEGMKSAAVAGTIVASGICLHSTFNHEGSAAKDAICCRLESIEDESLSIYMPYRARKKFFTKKEFSFGDIVASEKAPEIWPVS